MNIMKMNKLLMIILTVLPINVIAQVPFYVPLDSLVGWWPFNGNANDESGNGFHGVVYGAILASDRDGDTNRAYRFNGIDNWIEFGNIVDVSKQDAITISAWFCPSELLGYSNSYAGLDIGRKSTGNVTLRVRDSMDYEFQCLYSEADPPGIYREYVVSDYKYVVNRWYHLAAIYQDNQARLYVNGAEQFKIESEGGALSAIPSDAEFYAGKSYTHFDIEHFYIGQLDDIGIWNRALTYKEILGLFGKDTCSLIMNHPEDQLVRLNADAEFNVSILGPYATFQWQSVPANYGWVNVPRNVTYVGGRTGTLAVKNVQLSNHLQPFRVIVSDDSCSQVSHTAILRISDTCLVSVIDTVVITDTNLVTITDTTFVTDTSFIEVKDTISVTDTLIIDVVVGLATPDNINLVKIYPNPASDHIIIDYGDYGTMSGYIMKITDSSGKTVFVTTIDQQSTYIDLRRWFDEGVYLVHLIDPQGNTVAVRTIVIQYHYLVR